MAGRPPAFTYTQFKEFHAQFTAAGKEPTYEDIKARFEGKGSCGLISAYKTKLRGEQTALPETSKIPDDLATQIRAGLMALHVTIRAEAEASLQAANYIQVEELMQIGSRQDQEEEDHRCALDEAQEVARKALVQLEDRDVEIVRLRQELQDARAELRRLDVACNVAVAERDEARGNAARLALALELERSACSAAAQSLAVALERSNGHAEQLVTLKAECLRLAALERNADEVAGLKALLQVNAEKVELMSQLHTEQQETIIGLTTEKRILQRERDEFRGRADEVQKMHLSSLGVHGAAPA